jgi:hypothetical protein
VDNNRSPRPRGTKTGDGHRVLVRTAVLILLIVGIHAATATAQTTATTIPAPAPPGPYVIDVRGGTIGAPRAAGFYPAVPVGTRIPTRAFGLDVGGHVYLFRLGAARMGLGANFYRLRGTAQPLAVKAPSGSTPPTNPPAAAATPDMKSTVTTIAPQLSLNFGSSTGWSYISAGLGRAQVTTERSAFAKGEAETRDSGGLSSLNFGGGARWFTSDHLAFTFDIRFHLLSAGKAQGSVAGTPSNRVVSASAGISLR